LNEGLFNVAKGLGKLRIEIASERAAVIGCSSSVTGPKSTLDDVQ